MNWLCFLLLNMKDVNQKIEELSHKLSENSEENKKQKTLVNSESLRRENLKVI